MGICGVAVLMICGDAVNKISTCGACYGDLKPYGVRCLCFYVAVFGEMKLLAVLRFLV